ncbi:MAG: response regulator receiver protein [Desulfomicrobiaceae bacterium]|jgi:DNA-binding NtrC family response regulator|uniref:response regulator n=1 Tax=Thermodesulfomicrobium sp. WS TaxID=3004129 RepID=UPI000EE078AB|nr:response regulator [Thermodesulfomicrobium sp. WS]MBC7356637.1 response regulator [Desulfomicrobiaceae bacterium]MBZ4684489.1 response regulator receiver protein [Desulfomicrobiaceae bacterium]MDI3493799.1 hypothetical protein [Desulfomicrobiaceae bacterium]MDK2874089.1 hypothetical protein [Desulfomicrobiaceae bacterium]BDV00643.1 response regulator [Thermodesulfomicrobium sp. WS]
MLVAANVLLVDDDAQFTEIMRKRLSVRGMRVRTAHSGLETLACLAADPEIEVVVLDVRMPGMDGLETLRRIKAEHPLVEVIMLSAHATMDDAVDGMMQGAFDYLLKPCPVEILDAKIRAAVSRKREHEEKILDARLAAQSCRQD